jgi:DNA polymerase III delta prime subunit
MTYIGSHLIRGSEGALDALVEKLAKEKVIERNSPDLFARAYRSFGVSEAEDVRNRARTRAVAGEYRVFVLFVPSMTTEAQNSLLKTLEEPVAGALFFLITPAPETLLPTIRSRVQTLELPKAKEVDALVDADDFLAESPEKRLVMLKSLYEHEDEGRDVGSVIAFLSSLERRFASEMSTGERKRAIHAIYRARKYATDKGSLLKALLEQVALLCPKL